VIVGLIVGLIVVAVIVGVVGPQRLLRAQLNGRIVVT
jgi:hypothetical protein